MLIEFNPEKDAINQVKYGVSLELAQYIDLDAALFFEGDREDYGETRYRGYVRIEGRLYVFWFTWRGEVFRIIGIRKANPTEVKRYGERV